MSEINNTIGLEPLEKVAHGYEKNKKQILAFNAYIEVFVTRLKVSQPAIILQIPNASTTTATTTVTTKKLKITYLKIVLNRVAKGKNEKDIN